MTTRRWVFTVVMGVLLIAGMVALVISLTTGSRVAQIVGLSLVVVTASINFVIFVKRAVTPPATPTDAQTSAASNAEHRRKR